MDRAANAKKHLASMRNQVKGSAWKNLGYVKLFLVGLHERLLLSLHRGINTIRRRKPVHLVICGPARSGTTMLFNMIRTSAEGSVYVPDREQSALQTLSLFRAAYITKRPLDLYAVDEIVDKLGAIRDLRFLITLRDPRSLVTSFHHSVPNQYNQSWDFGFYTGPNVSFSRPGVGSAFKQIEELMSRDDIRHLVVKYEDLVTSPEDFRKKISDFSGLVFANDFSNFHKAAIPDGLQTQMNGVRTVDKGNAERWRNRKYRQRLENQLSLFPEMEAGIKRFGYIPSADAGLNPVEEHSRTQGAGTVVAMHTPDEVYRAEAYRLRRSLERISVSYLIDELPPARELAGLADTECEYPEWFIQKLARYFKPTWLLEKRISIDGPILYTDADSFFHRNPWPYLGQYDGDMAVFTRRNPPDQKAILNSGVIWFNDTAGARQIISRWKKACDAERKRVQEMWPDVKPSASDQPLLSSIVRNDELSRREFNIQRLPPTMMSIFDYDRNNRDQVFIEQLQASRVAKNQTRGDLRPSVPDARSQRIKELNALLNRPVE